MELTLKTFLVAVAATILMQASALAGMWLKPGSVFTASKEDLEHIIQLVVNHDKQAANEMVTEGKVLIAAQTRKKIFQTNKGFGAGFTGFIEFRFKGSTDRYWTTENGVEED
jgi:hypothetical protein